MEGSLHLVLYEIAPAPKRAAEADRRHDVRDVEALPRVLRSLKFEVVRRRERERHAVASGLPAGIEYLGVDRC